MFSFAIGGPHHHQSTPLSRNNFPTHSYLPQTPSPLRSSRNANLMPPPPTPSLKSSPLSEEQFSYDFSSPFFSDTGDENGNHTPHSDSSNSASTTPNFFGGQPVQESRFTTRARSASPLALLNNATTSACDRRRTLFLDRIRQRRDDDRFADKGDQVLRMDFVRERREREQRLARKAPDASFGLDAVDEMIDEEARIKDEEELSPMEEKEMEELLSSMPPEYGDGGVAYESEYVVNQDNSHQLSWAGDVERRPGYAGGELSDEDDYDQIFMEMEAGSFGLNTGPTTCAWLSHGNTIIGQADNAHLSLPESTNSATDTDMEMS